VAVDWNGKAARADIEVGDVIKRVKRPGHDWHYVNTPGRYQKHVIGGGSTLVLHVLRAGLKKHAFNVSVSFP
jgi:hypothetical protein